MVKLPAPHCLKAVELGIIDPESVVPREWMYDFYMLCPATPGDCVGFFRQFGATNEVDDNTYLALIAAGYFRHVLDGSQVTQHLVQRFSSHAQIDSGLRGCLEQLTSANISVERVNEICVQILFPYQQFAEQLLGNLPEPDEFTCWR